MDFPERSGALKRFLAAVSPAFHITLFHYRKTGKRCRPLVLSWECTKVNAPCRMTASCRHIAHAGQGLHALCICAALSPLMDG